MLFRSTFDAVAGFSMEGKISHHAGVSRSCHPFGESFKITRAEGNLIYEMDGHPAYDILLDSISNLPIENTDQIFQKVFLGVPMHHFQTDFSTSPYLIRNILGVNAKKGMLACATPIEEGEYVTFAVRDPGIARENFIKTLRDLSSDFSGTKPAFGIYFNCGSRGQALYGESGEDTKLIRQYFPDLPVIGFFSYGEIAPIDHINHVHYHSGVLSLYAEQS